VELAITLNNNWQAGNQLWDMLYARGLVGFVHHGERTIVIRDISTDPRWPTLLPRSELPVNGSAIGLPLNFDGYSSGVMMFVHPEVDAFDTRVTEFLEDIARLVSETLRDSAFIKQTQAHQADDDETANIPAYQNYFFQAQRPVILTDLHRRILDANEAACTLLGRTAEELREHTLSSLQLLDSAFVGLQQNVTNNFSRPTKFHAVMTTTENLDHQLTVTAKQFMTEQAMRIEWVLEDITEQTQLEQLRNDLTAMVYHDLRGPLQNIKFSLSALKRSAPADNARVTSALKAAQRSVQQLSYMISNLLDIQKLESQQAILRRGKIPIRRVIRGAIEQTKATVAASKLEYKVELASDLPDIYIDADMIHRVITNLIENAAKYATTGKYITLKAVSQDNFVHVMVIDDGDGIEAHLRESIFEKFSRVRFNDAPTGTGLGLAFCRLAVEAHGGKIWVDSEAGIGSTFQFTLPIAPQNEARPLLAE
jgi:signal transduction histidine kinase